MSLTILAYPGYEEFASHFVTTARDILRARGLRAEVTGPDAATEAAADFRYRLDCTPAPHAPNSLTVVTGGTTITGIPGAVLSVTVTCSLTDVASGVQVMQSSVTANKGWGPGFGVNEAETAAGSLIEGMAERGIL